MLTANISAVRQRIPLAVNVMHKGTSGPDDLTKSGGPCMKVGEYGTYD